jgi:glycosyltransferase involved in cell wall biosynthesis
MKPLVSILIPAYNAAELIGDTLLSALAQTWERREIIVVDDGSRDQTLQVARQFEKRGVQVVSQENQGAAAARNSLLAMSRGDYIQWLDADDLLAPDKIEKQVVALGEYGNKRILLSSGWARFMCRPDRAKFVSTALWCDLSPVEWLTRRMEQNLYMQTATWLVSRELTEAAGTWDTRLMSDDDQEYFCRVLLASNGVRFVPEARVYYRASGFGSLSYIGTSYRKQQAHWCSIQLHVSYLRSLERSERTRRACLRFLQDRMAVFYPERLDIFREAEEVSRNLGGQLEVPRLPRKYAWIKALFGWGAVKRARLFLPRVKWSVRRSWDKTIATFNTRATDHTRTSTNVVERVS